MIINLYHKNEKKNDKIHNFEKLIQKWLKTHNFNKKEPIHAAEGSDWKIIDSIISIEMWNERMNIKIYIKIKNKLNSRTSVLGEKLSFYGNIQLSALAKSLMPKGKTSPKGRKIVTAGIEMGTFGYNKWTFKV